MPTGTLTVHFKSAAIPAFEDYFLSMNPENEDGSNPFFNEYWSQKFQCDLAGGNTQYGVSCTGKLPSCIDNHHFIRCVIYWKPVSLMSILKSLIYK